MLSSTALVLLPMIAGAEIGSIGQSRAEGGIGGRVMLSSGVEVVEAGGEL